MFTNQKLLGILLIVFIIGGSAYFAFTKFKQDLSSASASPSPSPQSLDFLYNKAPAPTAANGVNAGGTGGQQVNQQAQPTPQSAERPLSKNKKLGQFPG